MCNTTEMHPPPSHAVGYCQREPISQDLFNPIIDQSLKMFGRGQESKSNTDETRKRFPCLLFKMTSTDFFSL